MKNLASNMLKTLLEVSVWTRNNPFTLFTRYLIPNNSCSIRWHDVLWNLRSLRWAFIK